MTKPQLSPREYQLLAMFAEGASEKMAARKMGVGICTVKHHARGIRAKLKVEKMIAAVAKSFRLGVLQ